MSIVFSSSHIPVFNGIATVLTANGENVLTWNSEIKPVFDMLYELTPKILFIAQPQIDKAFIEAVRQYPELKLIVYGANIPTDIIDNVALSILPPTIPDIILKNIPVLATKVKKAANLVQFSGGFHVENMTSDLLYITNSASVQRGYINAHLSGPLFNSDYSVKVIGSYKMPCPQYIGKTNLKETLNFIQSAKVVLDYDWDIALDIVANKSFTITNVKNDLIPYYTSEAEMMELIHKYIRNEKARRKQVRDAYKAIIDKDTYFHRTAELGDILGIEEWRTKSLDTLKRYRI